MNRVKIKKYSALEVSNYLIKLSNFSLSPMKLQKLLYYAQGWHLAEKNRLLISETIEAWRYGPMIPSIYYNYKSYGNDNIKEVVIVESKSSRIELDKSTKEFLRVVFEHYNQYSAFKLSNMTHLEETPWSQVCKKYRGVINLPQGAKIPLETMKKYFKKLGDG